MHTKITHYELVVWYGTLASQSLICVLAWWRRNTGLAVYLTIEALISSSLFIVSHLSSAQLYYRAYCVGQAADYGAEVFLTFAIFRACQRTGIAGKAHLTAFQIIAGTFFGVAISTLEFPLSRVECPAWHWLFAADHVVNYWICSLLALAPLYARLIDTAKDVRLLLVYTGFSAYMAIHSGAVDYAILSHLVRNPSWISDFAYFFSLVLWFVSCCYKPAPHHWNTAETASLKEALRSRSEINSLSRHERVFDHDSLLLLRSSSVSRNCNPSHGDSPEG